MIPPNKGSSLFRDSSLNMTPRDNLYISGYESPNEILQDVLERAQTLIFVVKISDLKGETVSHGIPCKFAMLNSIEIRHPEKTIISLNW